MLDGAPLDAGADAILIGLVLPALVAIDRGVLRITTVRILIVLLLAWKGLLAATVVPDGWCVRFTSPAPLFVGNEVIPHAWDVRADWRSAVPRCSAVMTRGYQSIDRFPVWFYNLPPANLRQPATEEERPPHVSLGVKISGSLSTSLDGTFRVLIGDDVTLSAIIDGVAVDDASLPSGVSLRAGTHDLALSGTMTGERWAIVPQWNGADIWRDAMTTIDVPRAIDFRLRPWGRWVTPLLAGALIALAAIRLAWMARSAVVVMASLAMCALAIGSAGRSVVMRSMPLVFGVSGWLRIPRRLQNTLGAQLLVGVPFLALIAARGFDDIARVTWYTSGDDWWMFQRFAYRIYLEGYWLEGGEPTFWFQPLYRWIAGGLHMVFGDSSVGELFWDGACAWAGALFAFHVARNFAGFRWGMAAAVLTLLLMTAGPGWYLFGRGLSEITSAGLLYAAALMTLRGRASKKYVLLAGLCAAAAFYTRLNNLALAAAIAAFSLPIRVPAGDWFRWRSWLPKMSKPAFAGIAGAIVIAIILFGLRTYHYTGSVNLLAGTQAGARSVWQTTGAGESMTRNVIDSVLIVLTMADPPRFDPRSMPILIGVLAAILALAGVRRFRELPMNVSLFCLAGVLGAFVARGSAYPGRFSIHLIPVTVALAVCAVKAWSGGLRIGERRGYRTDRAASARSTAS